MTAVNRMKGFVRDISGDTDAFLGFGRILKDAFLGWMRGCVRLMLVSACDLIVI